jgi:hypothetical protein
MPEPTVDHLLRRLQRVERANHTWRLAAVTASAVLGVLVLLGATGRQGTTPVEELRATRLILVDAQGRPLGRVGVEADGTPRLFLMDANATPRVGLAVTADAGGTTRLGLGVATDGRPGLTLYDQRGVLRAVLSLAADGRAGLSFFDEAGAVSWQAPASTPERR